MTKFWGLPKSILYSEILLTEINQLLKTRLLLYPVQNLDDSNMIFCLFLTNNAY